MSVSAATVADPVLSVRAVSKKFCRNLKRSMLYGMRDLAANLVGLRLNTNHLRRDEFWALRDVSFDLQRGEFLGIVGSNGAGKSTLMRLLAGIFPPDAGEVHLRGRVGALIALGAGFHPHMTGRENIFLNGAILGMDRAYIRSRFDAIVQFAEIGEFLDAPVATYSSGMRVRLGFAVAVHMAPDLLLVDEVLSVGDASFRERCYSHMMAYKRNGGTVIFISHNTLAIEQVCERVLWLEHGQVRHEGAPLDVLMAYESQMLDVSRAAGARLGEAPVRDEEDLHVGTVEVRGPDGAATSAVDFGADFELHVHYRCRRPLARAYFGMTFCQAGAQVAMVTMLLDGIVVAPLAEGAVACRVRRPNLAPGNYTLQVFVHAHATNKLGGKFHVRPAQRGSLTVRPGALAQRFPGATAAHLVAGLPPMVLEHAWLPAPGLSGSVAPPPPGDGAA